MTMWPISARVNKPENNDSSLLQKIEQAEFAGGSRGGATS
jgi:hypothetical protein